MTSQSDSEIESRTQQSDLLRLGRWNTPTIYNGLEQYTQADRKTLVNLEETRDFMPQMGPMVGRAVTVVFEPSNPQHAERNPHAWQEYMSYIASVEGPKMVVCQDLDKPEVYGAGFGEVNATMHRASNCLGAIIDGPVRDIDEVRAVGFKVLARRLCVSHCYAHPVRWGVEVDVFGARVQLGQLIHADKHGFLLIPQGEEAGLLEAAEFMDALECETLISAGRSGPDIGRDALMARYREALRAFGEKAQARFGRGGEWSQQ